MNCSHNNGRVDIINADNKIHHLFTNNNNVLSSYKGALKGTLEESLLSKCFFCKDNIQIIQNAIRFGVYKKSHNKYVIKEQDVDTIKIIMRSIYLQNSKNQPHHITEQIKELNDMVSQYCIDKIYGEAEGYIKYKRDVSTMSVPLSLPVSSSYKHKTLKMKTFF
jgi:hypothetical protein